VVQSPPPRPLIRLAVRCRPDQADAVLAELLQLAPGGVEEESGADFVEYAIYGAPGELPDLGWVQAETAEGGIQVTSSEVPDDWADRWRDFHRPVTVRGRVVVRPSWAPPQVGDVIDVVVEPGQAFGTGAHPTTRMCLELLLELADAGDAHGSLCDLGTGSGVLAIAAAKLGWAPVFGVDSEQVAVSAACQNAAANAVSLELTRLNLREEPPPAAETIVANLTAPLLREVISRLRPLPGRLIVSGLLVREHDEVADSLTGAGLHESAHRTSGDWTAMLWVDRRSSP